MGFFSGSIFVEILRDLSVSVSDDELDELEGLDELDELEGVLDFFDRDFVTLLLFEFFDTATEPCFDTWAGCFI